ncbi:MAG: glutamate synthase-related protein [Kiritimatiellae bacterium]|nr:glutamate synthase-related protein [Kiritimatiellia bacterium]
MSGKYHIDVEPEPARFAPVSKLNHIELNRCLGCLQCARRDCIYDVFTDRKFLPRELVDSANRLCKACMRCVQECRNRILIKALNPEYLELGNAYWTPEIITSLWNQAATGKIPVSGAGYEGPFSGEGFDDMWTDMSEIVRPTRDGIHGREYINTAIDIGRKPGRLHFKDGQLLDELPPIVSSPLPILLDLPPAARRWSAVKQAVLHAARQLKLLVFDDAPQSPDEHVFARYAPETDVGPDCPHRLFEFCLESAEPEIVRRLAARIRTLSRRRPDAIIGVAVPLEPRTQEAVLHFVDQGISVLRVYADRNGREFSKSYPRFIKEAVRAIHLALVQTGRRDCVTLLAGGGIAMAEHVAKLIACGADGAVMDEALLAALECRICRQCAAECPVALESMDAAWGAQRITNLLGAWHSQLIEVLGAMGLREIRRLRGEIGRVMFFKDLEKECFAPIFGKRKD